MNRRMITVEAEEYEPPSGAMAFAEKRTKGILALWSIHGQSSLKNLIASCYLQGLSDAAEATKQKRFVCPFSLEQEQTQ